MPKGAIFKFTQAALYDIFSYQLINVSRAMDYIFYRKVHSSLRAISAQRVTSHNSLLPIHDARIFCALQNAAHCKVRAVRIMCGVTLAVWIVAYGRIESI